VQYVAAAGAVNVTYRHARACARLADHWSAVRILPNLANTTTTPTLNVNALARKTITKLGTPRWRLDISHDGDRILVYDGTSGNCRTRRLDGRWAGTVTTTGRRQRQPFQVSGAASTHQRRPDWRRWHNGTVVPLCFGRFPRVLRRTPPQLLITFDAKGRRPPRPARYFSAVGGAVGARSLPPHRHRH